MTLVCVSLVFCSSSYRFLEGLGVLGFGVFWGSFDRFLDSSGFKVNPPRP